MKQATALVQEAVGFNKERGDTVNVANVSFARLGAGGGAGHADLEGSVAASPRPRKSASGCSSPCSPGCSGRKAFKPLFEMFAAAAHRVEVEDRPPPPRPPPWRPRSPPGTARTYDDKLQQARDLAKQDPKLVAGVIKEWVGGESR